MNSTIATLPFDSSLFGYTVGKFQADQSWNEAHFLDQARACQLVYMFSQNPLSFVSKQIHLADIKLTFEKKLIENHAEDRDITHFNGKLSDPLLNLAFDSGVFSRFKTDPGFKDREYEKLYSLWIQNALKQNEVLVAKEFAGFVSCHLSGAEASIGLIAVGENHRGRGWGKRLVCAAENFAKDRGARILNIGTQKANIPAVNLYQSLGYRLTDSTYVYHYWSC